VSCGTRQTWLQVVGSVLLCSVSSVYGAREEPVEHGQRILRPVNVADAIQMNQLGELAYIRGIGARYSAAHFSPDGKSFLILSARGNIKRNTNDYVLLLFRSAQALRSPTPQVVAAFSSSSERPAIQDISWLDNRTIAFLGENPGEAPQLYSVDSETKALTKRTSRAGGLSAYAFAGDGSSFFYLSPHAPENHQEGAGPGVMIASAQSLPEFVGLDKPIADRSAVMDLFGSATQAGRETTVRIRGDISPWSPLWLSPNGRRIVVMSSVARIPNDWSSYQDFWLNAAIRRANSANVRRTDVYQYDVIDVLSGKTQVLLDAPAEYKACDQASITWSPDSKSVVVAGNLLPLDVKDPGERQLRKARKFVAEVRIESGEVIPISKKEVCPLGWNASGELRSALTHYYTQRGSAEAFVAFRREGDDWKEIPIQTSDIGENNRLAITLEEDMNTSPKLFAQDRQMSRKALLWDFNPQFKSLEFGRVEDVSFDTADGRRVEAGLYLPINYVKGRRFPLVIQTHGWDAHRFRIDGVYTSASAAQALAGRGIAVLQLNEGNTVGTGGEYEAKASAYEAAIDYLDKRGLLDRERVGIVGFSRTGLGVEYALTHSSYHIAAAVLADFSDGGYFAYLSNPERAQEFETLNGGAPFGDGLSSWLKLSPGFNLTRVTTPVREEAYSSWAVFWAWEWYAGLSRLGRPIELLYIPDEETHALVKPNERLISQDGTVDWMRFWLQGYEDPDRAKRDQYTRWEKLCDMQRAQSPGKPAFCVGTKH